MLAKAIWPTPRPLALIHSRRLKLLNSLRFIDTFTGLIDVQKGIAGHQNPA
jgi:hypothetical protein